MAIHGQTSNWQCQINVHFFFKKQIILIIFFRNCIEFNQQPIKLSPSWSKIEFFIDSMDNNSQNFQGDNKTHNDGSLIILVWSITSPKVSTIWSARQNPYGFILETWQMLLFLDHNYACHQSCHCIDINRRFSCRCRVDLS